MKNDEDLKKLLNNANGELDVFSPSTDHKFNFLQKLNEQQKTAQITVLQKKKSWYSKLGIAASVTVLIAVGLIVFLTTNKPEVGLANVSPEMEKTENFFNNAIRFQIEEINKTASLETSTIVEDGMQQLNKLEEDYQKLEKDLLQSNNNPKVISAMISNFQKRIDLLENILKEMENYSLQKNDKNGTKIL